MALLILVSEKGNSFCLYSILFMVWSWVFRIDSSTTLDDLPPRASKACSGDRYFHPMFMSSFSAGSWEMWSSLKEGVFIFNIAMHCELRRRFLRRFHRR